MLSDPATPAIEANAWKGSRGGAFRRFRDSVTVEPVIACYMTAFTLITLTVSNLNLLKACKVNLALGDEACDAMLDKTSSKTGDDEIQVQRLVGTMMLWQTCVQNAVPCALMLLAGSWSDRTRRRVPCMLLPLYGELARNAAQLVCVYLFHQLPMEAAGVAETVPLALTGGQTLITMTAYSYVGDITSADDRTFRVGMINAVMATSMAIGTSLSGIIYNKLGFYGAYGISSVLIIIGLVYGSFFVKDIAPVVENDKKKSYKTTLSEFFDFKSIGETLKMPFKERPNNKKHRIIILLIILMTGAGTNAGLLFSFYILSKKFRISDEVIGILSTLSQSLSALFYAFAYNEFVFSFGPLVNVLVAAEMLSVKSLMTKLVPNTEISQIAAIFAIAEISVSLLFGLLYNIVYETTLDTIPGAFYLIGFLLNAPTIALFVWMYLEQNKEKYDNSTAIFKHNSLKSKVENYSNYGAIKTAQ